MAPKSPLEFLKRFKNRFDDDYTMTTITTIPITTNAPAAFADANTLSANQLIFILIILVILFLVALCYGRRGNIYIAIGHTAVASPVPNIIVTTPNGVTING